MPERNHICKACNGSGLLADDENWQYGCSICGGDGIFKPGESSELKEPFSIDENNRTLE